MGGNAFNGTRRILRNEIIPTLSWLEQEIFCKTGELTSNILGSATKTESSGDIDLNIDIDKYQLLDFAIPLKFKFGETNVTCRNGNNQIFTKIPILGNPNNGYVQIDFMFGNHTWQSFSYWSPGNTSKFKGLFRTELIKAIISYKSDYVLYENNELIVRIGPTFFHDKGIIWRTRYRPIKKNKTGRIKNFKEITFEQCKSMFPNALPPSNYRIIEPNKVALFIFDDENLEVFHNYETLVNKLKQHYNLKSYNNIMMLYQQRLNSLKVDIPMEIMHEINSGNGRKG